MYGRKVGWQSVALFCLVLAGQNCLEDQVREVHSPPTRRGVGPFTQVLIQECLNSGIVDFMRARRKSAHFQGWTRACHVGFQWYIFRLVYALRWLPSWPWLTRPNYFLFPFFSMQPCQGSCWLCNCEQFQNLCSTSPKCPTAPRRILFVCEFKNYDTNHNQIFGDALNVLLVFSHIVLGLCEQVFNFFPSFYNFDFRLVGTLTGIKREPYPTLSRRARRRGAARIFLELLAIT